MSLAPHSRRGYKYETCNSHATEMITGQQSHLGEIPLKEQGQGEGIRRQQRAKSRCDDRDERENKEGEIAFP
jgi:hypothetical protein